MGRWRVFVALMAMAVALVAAPSASTLAAPASGSGVSVSMRIGWNLIDLPVQGITKASDLTSSLDASLGANSIEALATYSSGHFTTYVPGYSTEETLQPWQGILALSTVAGTWTPSGSEYTSATPVPLAAGFNLVAAPFPQPGLSPRTISSEISSAGGTLQLLASMVDGHYQVWMPRSGGPVATVPFTSGMFLLVNTSSPITWTPS